MNPFAPRAVIAHRGASAYCPENTEAAVLLALKQGADAIECDVQLTSDHAPIVCHDYDLKRIGGSDAVILHCKERDLVGRSVAVEDRTGDPARLLSLRQWLELIPRDRVAVVELKQQRTKESNARLLAGTTALLQERVGPAALISFSFRITRATMLQTPEIPSGAIRGKPFEASTKERDLRRLLHVARPLVVLKKTIASEEVVHYFKSKGKVVLCYALDEPEEIEDALARGVEGLITNRPDVAKRVLVNGSRRRPDA